MPLFHSVEAGTLAAPPTDAVGKTVPTVAGAAAGTATDAAPSDDVGPSAAPFDDTAGKTRVPVTASAAGSAVASTTAVGADCYGPSDRENIDISILSTEHSSIAPPSPPKKFQKGGHFRPPRHLRNPPPVRHRSPPRRRYVADYAAAAAPMTVGRGCPHHLD